jgi:phenylacetate-CoA ligase
LIASTYYNSASRFIRYDTGDDIVPLQDGRILGAFRMAAGRTADFVIDRNGQRISLTALIFGRHHEAFGVAEFVQVRQTEQGRVTILLVPASGVTSTAVEWPRLFDFRNVDLDVEFEVRDRPVRTPAGKTPLLVTDAAKITHDM